MPASMLCILIPAAHQEKGVTLYTFAVTLRQSKTEAKAHGL
jgi:hypothetical protein